MHANAQPTKASELIRFGPKANRAGFIIPPFETVPPILDRATAVRTLDRFMRMDRCGGTYSDWLIIRDNGGPEGTGARKSYPFLNFRLEGEDQCLVKAHLRKFRTTMGQVLPDATVQEAMIQQLVGQKLSGDGEVGFYAPFASGVAYTPDCTTNGKNAVVLWTFGLPLDVVKGGGQYVAFNRSNMAEEAERLNPHGVLQDTLDISGVCQAYGTRGNVDIDLFDSTLENRGSTRERLERMLDYDQFVKSFLGLFDSVLKIGEEEGAVYKEWAMTYINGLTRLFLLQASEFGGKIPGLTRTLYKELEGIGDAANVRISDKRLQALFEAAIHDPHCMAAGFGAIGNGTRAFEEMMLFPSREKLRQLGDIPLLVWDSKTEHRSPIEEKLKAGRSIGGFVEWKEDLGAQHSFITHFGGLLRGRSVLGLGNIREMDDKLYAFFPPECVQFAGQGNLRVKGKFVLEVNENANFGSLKVLEVAKVEPL